MTTHDLIWKAIIGLIGCALIMSGDETYIRIGFGIITVVIPEAMAKAAKSGLDARKPWTCIKCDQVNAAGSSVCQQCGRAKKGGGKG